ncbi:MAG: DMT family transporter [Rhodobacterales bacterium]|nr:DMT family transporter [Rhodobacterales bacterium]
MMSAVSSTLRPQADRLALAALIGGAMALGFSPILVRLSTLEPTATAFHRAFLALPMLWLMVRLTPQGAGVGEGSGGRAAGAMTRQDWALMALAGLFFAGDLAFWHWSLRYTSVANATLFATSSPIFVALIGFALFGERFTRTFLVGMLLSLAGAAALVGGSAAGLGGGSVLGDVLGIVTALFLAGYIVTVGRVRARATTARVMFHSSLVTAGVLLPVSLLAGEGLVADTVRGWLVLLGLAGVAHVAGQGLLAYALAHLPAAFSSLGLLLEPVLAALWAWVLFGEALGPWQAAGGGLVLAGIALARKGSR